MQTEVSDNGTKTSVIDTARILRSAEEAFANRANAAR